MPPLPPLAIDEYDFASLRQAGQVYVDKTAYIQRMLEEPIKYAFLARPCRFGKSLLVSTLAHLFGRTDDALFRDLAIAAYLPQVPPVPVILLDMSRGVGQTLGASPRGLAGHRTRSGPSGSGSFCARRRTPRPGLP